MVIPFRRVLTALIPLGMWILGGLPPEPIAGQMVLPPATHQPRWWTVDDGLPGNAVRDLVQSIDGRLWMISGGILTRFDGRSFETIPLELPPPAEGSVVELPHALATGDGDTVWVDTTSRRMAVRTRGQWHALFPTPDPIYEMRTTPGSLPLARAEGDDRVRFQFGGDILPTGPFDFARRYPDERILSLWLDRDGTRWAMLAEEAAAVTLPPSPLRTLRSDRPNFVFHRDGSHARVTQRREGRLEVVDPQGVLWASIPERPDRTPLLLTRDGRLLVHAGLGLEIHGPSGGAVETVPLGPNQGLRLLDVSTVFEDQEGGIWVGTLAQGLLNLRRRVAIQVVPKGAGLGATQVGHIGQGRGGSVLAVGAEILRIDGGGVEEIPLSSFPPHRQITAVMEDGAGTRWVGLIAPDGRTEIWKETPDGTRTRFLAVGIPRKFVDDPARQRTLWLSNGEWCALAQSEPGSPAAAPQCHDVIHLGPRDLRVDREGSIWVAGEGGVQVYSAAGMRALNPATGYPLDWARSLHEDAERGMWIGTYFRGLLLLRGDSIYSATQSEGLAENVVSTLLEDRSGIFWMGGNRGVHQVARSELLELFRGERTRVSGALLDGRQGLLNPEGSGWYGQTDGEGRLWFPTFGGAVAVLPEGGERLRVDPGAVTLDAIHADGRSWPVSDTLALPKGVRSVEVAVAAVSLQFPEAEVVKYRLEGQGADWRSATGNRALEFTNLPPGQWLLEVEGWGREDGDPSRATLVIVIPPYFRETPAFPLLLGLGIFVLVVVAVRVRTRTLLARAESLQAEVDEQTHWLQVENARTTAALAQAAEVGSQLRELLTSKTRVFAALSHELRTPLTLLSGPLGELEGGEGTAASERLSVMRKAVRRMERLTGQFLDLAEAQAGTLQLRRREQPLGSFIERCIEEIRPLGARKGVAIRWEGPMEEVRARIDPEHFDKVVLNLLGNAIRHSPPGGTVKVQLTESDSWAVLQVTDGGPGVPEGIRDRIFDPFFQGPNAVEGMGLGLSLSRDVVIMHGGRIELEETEASEGGATFRVQIPTAQESASRPPEAPTVPLDSVPSEPKQPEPADAPSHPLPQKIRVLLVEDDFDLREFLERELSPNFDLRSVEHGEGALEMLRVWKPDLVLSDIVMPGLDGLGLCRILKADPATRGIPFILLTARSQAGDQERGLIAGADDYIVKPFDLSQLSRRIENLVRLSRRIEERFSQAFPSWAMNLLRQGVDQLDAPAERFLEQFYGVVIEQMGDPDLDVERLSRALLLSRSALYRKCRELLRSAPMDAIAEIRLEQAALLLADPERSVSSVARDVGYRRHSHFTQRFTAHFGVSPRAYRTRKGGGESPLSGSVGPPHT
jgi:signal transduction histidine kinase/CheY-like chemotaxis protein